MVVNKGVSDLVYDALSSILNDFVTCSGREQRKHFKTIGCTFTVKFSMHGKGTKLVQNYICSAPNAFKRYTGKVLFFGDDSDLKYFSGYNNEVINGLTFDKKNIKKHIRWCIFTDDKHIASVKSLLLKKGMLSNNYRYVYDSFGLEKLISSILSGYMVKLFRFNNQVSCLVGDISMQHGHIVDNIMCLLDFVNDNIGKVKTVNIHRSMCKSYKILL